MTRVPASTDDLAAVLARSDLFARLVPAERRRLAAAARERPLAAGQVLFRAGEPGDALYLVAEGELAVQVPVPGGGARELARIGPGQCVGELALLADGRRSATVQALADTRLVALAKPDLLALVERDPGLRRLLGDLMLRRLPRLHLATSELFRALADHVLDDLRSELRWLSLPRGEVLCEAGTAPRGLYVVVNGRLGLEAAGAQGRPGRALGRGEVLGELELVAGEPHRHTARALRDTDLVLLSREGFERILERNPQVALSLLRRAYRQEGREDAGGGAGRAAGTLAVLALDAGAAGLARELAAVLGAWGRVRYLDRGAFDALHGQGAADLDDDDPRALHVRDWLTSQESAHDRVILDAGTGTGGWALRCLRQADRLLVVASAGDRPAAGPARDLAEARGADLPRELVLVHPAGTGRPRGTAPWLEAWRCERHHHVRAGARADVERVARFLAGRAVGLVLGAGGARGFAHLGVLRALAERGVPVDALGGVSMGAFLAALVAADQPPREIVRIVRRVLVERPRGFGYTLPLVSLMSVRRAEQRFRDLFGESGLEDLWRPLFCVSVNLSRPAMHVQRTGPAWRAVRASLAIPGLIAPLFEEGELLVDGALLNSVPTDIMRADGHGPVIASDVGKAPALQVDPALDACPSPWRLLARRLQPWRPRDEVPRMGSILTRCLDVSTLMHKQQSRAQADLYLTPPLERFRILDMDRIDEIIATGYDYAARRLDALDMEAFLASAPVE